MFGVVKLISCQYLVGPIYNNLVYVSKNPRAGSDLLTLWLARIIKMCQTPKCENMGRVRTLLNVNNAIRIQIY